MLSTSLYLPQVARYMAFARCAFAVAMHVDGTQICDCEKINPAQHTLPASADNKQKDITEKTGNWQYLEPQQWQITQADARFAAALPSTPSARLCNGCGRDVFHPPKTIVLL